MQLCNVKTRAMDRVLKDFQKLIALMFLPQFAHHRASIRPSSTMADNPILNLVNRRSNSAPTPTWQDQDIELTIKSSAMVTKDDLAGECFDFNHDPILPIAPNWSFNSLEPSKSSPRNQFLMESFKSSLYYLQLPPSQAIDNLPRKDRLSVERKQIQEQHRKSHGDKKLLLRRQQLMREAEEAQDQEPTKVSPFNALPHFEYLEIAENVGVELPEELAALAAMNLSKEVPNETSEDIDNDGSRDSSPETFGSLYDSTEDIRAAAAGMLDQLEDDPAEEPYSGHPNDGFSPPDPPYMPPSNYQATRSQPAPPPNLDNLLCNYVTCPVVESHTEGPYFHNGELGDQNHPHFKGSNPPPHVWEAYARVMDGSDLWMDQEMVDSFWAWHVPPFYDMSEKKVEEKQVEDQEMGDG